MKITTLTRIQLSPRAKIRSILFEPLGGPEIVEIV